MFRITWLLICLFTIAPLAYSQVPVEEEESVASAEPATSHMSMEQRVEQLERQMRNQVEVLKRNQALSQQLKELQGQLEVQSHDISVLKEQQKSQFSDLDQRVNDISHQKTESTTTDKKPTTTEVKKKNSTASITTEDKKSPHAEKNKEEKDKKQSGEKAYQAAYALLKNKNYDKAQSAFRKFIQTYPDDPNQMNAHYWLGFSYLLKSQPDKAITEFKTVIKLDTDHVRTAEATRKIALARTMKEKK